MLAYLKAIRPKTLPAALLPIVFAYALLIELGHQPSLLLCVATLLSSVCIQVATNYFNDAIDADKGADAPDRLGPERATAQGWLTRQQVMKAAFVSLVLAAICALPLIFARGWIILAIGIPSLFLSYGYTGGPYPLAYKGLGEVFVMIFFGFVAVAGTCFVLIESVPAQAWGLGWVAGALSCALIAINNARDVVQDARVGKQTLAVLFGLNWMRFLILMLWLSQYAILLRHEYLWRGLNWTVLLYGIPISVGGSLVIGIYQEYPSARYNRFLARAALQLILVACIFIIRRLYL